MGPLPAAGQWVRLEVPASQVGLEGKTLNGMGFTLYGGRATWDKAGKSSAGANIQWLVSDQLGTPRMVVDETGSLSGVKRHDYLPFGEEIQAGTGGRTQHRGYGQVDDVRQQFAVSERDDETGLDFMQARYYAGPQGRFTGVDPYNIILEAQATAELNAAKAQAQFSRYLSQPQQWNRYAYVINNPLKYNDPTGELLELTGNEKDREIALQRIKGMVGKKAAGLLYVREEKGRFYVDYRGSKGDSWKGVSALMVASDSAVGVFLTAIIDRKDKTVEFRVATTYDTKTRKGLSVAAEDGGGTTVGAESSTTGHTQIFVHPDAGNEATWRFGTTGLGQARSSNGRQLDFDNDMVDAHELGHAYANAIEGHAVGSVESSRRAVQFENFARGRRGMNTNRRKFH